MSLKKNRQELPRYCPLRCREIACEECYEIGMVAEGAFPVSELPPGMNLTEADADRCKNCEEHID